MSDMRRLGRELAQQHYRLELFPVGYDFDTALALFNQHCHAIDLEPMDERFFDSDPGTETMEALCAFFEVIEQLAPYQGPEYECPDGTSSRSPTAAWEQAHPYWQEDEDTYQYGRRIQVRRKEDGFHVRVVCPELLWEQGSFPSAQEAMEAGKAKLDATVTEEQKQRWLRLQERLASDDWQIGEGDSYVC